MPRFEDRTYGKFNLPNSRKVCECVTVNITYADSSASLGKVPATATILGVIVGVKTAFNGTGASLIVGYSGDTDRYVAAGDLDESSTGTTPVFDNYETLAVEKEILATYSETSGGTTGDAQVTLLYAY